MVVFLLLKIGSFLVRVDDLGSNHPIFGFDLSEELKTSSLSKISILKVRNPFYGSIFFDFHFVWFRDY